MLSMVRSAVLALAILGASGCTDAVGDQPFPPTDASPDAAASPDSAAPSAAVFDRLRARLGETGAPASMDVAILARVDATEIRRHRDEPLARPDGTGTSFSRELIEARLSLGEPSCASRPTCPSPTRRRPSATSAAITPRCTPTSDPQK